MTWKEFGLAALRIWVGKPQFKYVGALLLLGVGLVATPWWLDLIYAGLGQATDIPRTVDPIAQWVGVGLVVVAVIYGGLLLFRGLNTPDSAVGAINITVPKNAPFGAVAKAIVRDAGLRLEGFTEAELATPLDSRHLAGASVAEVLIALRSLAQPASIRAYSVTKEGAVYTVRIV